MSQGLYLREGKSIDRRPPAAITAIDLIFELVDAFFFAEKSVVPRSPVDNKVVLLAKSLPASTPGDTALVLAFQLFTDSVEFGDSILLVVPNLPCAEAGGIDHGPQAGGCQKKSFEEVHVGELEFGW